MTLVSSDLLQNMVKAITAEVSPEQIVLFGSWAKGIARPDSDIDILVIESDSFGPKHSRRKEMTRIWNALKIFLVPVDILLYSKDEVERWSKSLNHVVSRAIKEGKVLYDKRAA